MTLNKTFLSIAIFAILSISHAQSSKNSTIKPLFPIPTKEQMAWHEMEMNAFIHFTINTFTGLEWGNGDENKTLFNPSETNVNQWAKVIKDTGFKMIIFTSKHHDGFCLWPSKFTEHSIKNTPYKNGKGDLVKEVSDAAKKNGLKFGIYLSPWDRNHENYGQMEYIKYYRNQLNELFSNYGNITEMWLDGANGGFGYYGGKRENRIIDRKTYYDWTTTIKELKKKQPKVLVFSDAGPDIRWVGNESGILDKTNWNTLTIDTLYAGKSGIEHLLNSGSILGNKWVPGEADVSIRPGWFFHEEENNKVKTPEQLFEIYLTSVGRGSTLLLNIPPDKRGLIHENDVKALQGFRNLLNTEFGANLAKNAKITASNYRSNLKSFSAKNLIDDDKNTYWATDEEVNTASIEIHLSQIKTIKYLMLQEYIQLGQRVKSFSVDVWKDNKWEEIAKETTIGYKRILKFTPIVTTKVRINILDAKACPVLSNIALF